jgi:hypothetical protein
VSNARVDLVWCDHVERILNLLPLIKFFIISQFFEASAFVDLLNLTKYSLDRVQVWGISQVEYRKHVQEPVGIHRVRALMYRQIIHEDS